MSDAIAKNEPDHLTILQAGAAKSGNLWLYKIIEHIIRQAQLPQESFIQRHPIYPIAKTWKLSYKEQADIDMLDIEPQKCFYRISSVFRMPIEDIRAYLNRTTHPWTHSRFCSRSFDVFPLMDKIVYIIRDPRDRAISAAKFAFTEYMLNYFPHNEQNPERYLDNRLEAMIERWLWHVYDYVRYSRELDIHLVFYERLLHNFDSELENLLDYLGVSLHSRQKQEIADAVTFNSMKRKNPNHLRKGSSGGWKEVMTRQQIQRTAKIAGPLMEYLNYPLMPEEDQGELPLVPPEGSRAEVEGLLRLIRV